MIETKIIYQDISPTGKLVSTYSGVNIESYSDYISTLNNEKNTTEDITTLEHNIWVLDGSKKLFPDNTDSVTWGLVSHTISGEDGVFAEGEEPQLIVEFADLQESVGITFDFDIYKSDYPTKTQIIYYNGETVLDDSIYNCNSADAFTFVKEVSNYNKIVVKFLETKLPFRRMRLINIYYGITRIFGHDELNDISSIEEIDSISSELSINTLDFNVRNTSDIPFLFQKMQPISLMYGDNLMGTYYIDESKRLAVNNYEINCIDDIGVLDLSQFLGGLYINKNASELVDEIMDDTRIDYSISDDLLSSTVSGYIPICTKREALLYVCFAIGAVADTSRNDKVEIRKLSDIPTKTFSDEETFQDGSVTKEGKVTTVQLTAYSYSETSEAENELFKGTLNVGENIITFTSPHYAYSVTGGSIVDSGVNYVKINVASAGEVVLKGKSYVEAQLVFSKDNPNVKSTDVQNVVESSSCQLINTSNVNDVLNRLYDYCMRSESIEAKAVIDNSVSVGDIVNIPTPYNETVACRITRMKLGFGASKVFADIEGELMT